MFNSNLSLFYLFDQLNLVRKGIESTWNVPGIWAMVVNLTMTFINKPMAKNMNFSAGICGSIQLGCSAVQGLGIHPVYVNPVLQQL